MSRDQLPSFISPARFNSTLRGGRVPDVDVQCKSCGALGKYDNWITGFTNSMGKLCPSCGHYRGERI